MSHTSHTRIALLLALTVAGCGAPGTGLTHDRARTAPAPARQPSPPARTHAAQGLSSSTQRLALGEHTSCVLRDRRVSCWGPLQFEDPTPRELPSLAGAVEIAVGPERVCALLPGGGVRCVHGQAIETVAGLVGARSIAVGNASACAARSDGHVVCWTAGGHQRAESLSPFEIAGIEDAVELTSGEFICARRAAGTVACFRGPAPWDLHPSVWQVRGVEGALQVSMGHGSACAVVAGGEIVCWPIELGPLAARVAGVSDAVQVVRGSDSTCIRTATGAVKCWGRGSVGRLGDGTLQDRTVDAPAVPVRDAVALAGGGAHACAIRRDATIVCWGEDGDGRSTGELRSFPPTAVRGLDDAAEVETGMAMDHDGFFCVRRRSGRVACWGELRIEVDQPDSSDGTGDSDEDDEGVGGEAYVIDSSVPQDVAGLTGVTQLAGGGSQLCALVAGGRLSCWGSSVNREIGLPAGGALRPRLTARIARATAVAAGLDLTCALVVGSPVCMGMTGASEIGSPYTPFRAVRGLVDLAVGLRFGCGRTATGAVRCFGRHVPEVPATAHADQLALGPDWVCGHGHDGWQCWDDRAPEPSTLPSIRDGDRLAFALHGACVLTPGQPLRCSGTAAAPGSPRGAGLVEIPGVADVVDVAIGSATCAVRRDGVVYCWGRDDRCQLGNGACGGALVPTVVSLSADAS